MDTPARSLRERCCRLTMRSARTRNESFDFRAGALDDRRVLLLLAHDEIAKLRGRRHPEIHAVLGNAIAEPLRPCRLSKRRVQAIDRGLRCFRRGEHALPTDRLVSW